MCSSELRYQKCCMLQGVKSFQWVVINIYSKISRCESFSLWWLPSLTLPLSLPLYLPLNISLLPRAVATSVIGSLRVGLHVKKQFGWTTEALGSVVFSVLLVCVFVQMCTCPCMSVRESKRSTGSLKKITGLKWEDYDSFFSVSKSRYVPLSVLLCGCSDFLFRM